MWSEQRGQHHHQRPHGTAVLQQVTGGLQPGRWCTQIMVCLQQMLQQIGAAMGTHEASPGLGLLGFGSCIWIFRLAACVPSRGGRAVTTRWPCCLVVQGARCRWRSPISSSLRLLLQVQCARLARAGHCKGRMSTGLLTPANPLAQQIRKEQIVQLPPGSNIPCLALSTGQKPMVCHGPFAPSTYTLPKPNTG